MQKINLNVASCIELEGIDGVDGEFASALVRKRDELGRFRDWSDVDQIPGCDADILSRLRACAELGESEELRRPYTSWDDLEAFEDLSEELTEKLRGRPVVQASRR